MKNRVFVGTMYCGEGDFDKCVDAISSQHDVDVHHEVISNLPEKDAHNALWSAWRSSSSQFDVFVKVDADTVLASNTVLHKICALFENPRVTGLQAPLHDYMTNGFINGLNAFSNSVTFNDTVDELYCDRHVDVGHDIVLREKDLPPSLRPAAFHCHNANSVQAFHYGLHRMLKGQRTTIERVHCAWMKERDKIRGYALLGSSMSHRFEKNRRFNYSDDEFIDAYNDALVNYDKHVLRMQDDTFCRL